VDGLRAGEQRGGEDTILTEVAVLRRGRTDADALVGEGDMQAVAVGLGVDGDGGNAHLLAGADDADGDLAAVRNQNFRKHSISISAKENSALTASLSPTKPLPSAKKKGRLAFVMRQRVSNRSPGRTGARKRTLFSPV